MVKEKKLGALVTLTESAVDLCRRLDDGGADELMLVDVSSDDAGHDKSIGMMKKIIRNADAQVIAGGRVKRVEDVKKYLYAGARMVFLQASEAGNIDMLKEVSDRFGKEKIAVYLDDGNLSRMEEYDSLGAGSFILDAGNCPTEGCGFPVILLTEKQNTENLQTLLSIPGVTGVMLAGKAAGDFMEKKHVLKGAGLPMNTFESSVSWKEFKLLNDGLLPVIVQDYRTGEVLMMAYMNEQAFTDTLKTGKMNYYSRSRKSQWLKGETSGHFQYVKSLHLDCDNDTLLAKVAQVGAACHTGSRSCFYQTLAKKEYDETNPLMVFEKVYDVIMDRKLHPKEGSYTNYLFDKGIDKILKKVGEEATEIIIAAKNPDPEEIIYEISDFLYHAMVLMAEKGVSWEDITKELANR